MAVSGARPDVIDVKALGAGGLGTNSNEFFLGAQLGAKARTRVRTGSTTVVGTTTIDIPAGDYTITALNGMLGLEAQSGVVVGLRIRGAGSGLTNIFFNPSTDGALLFNDLWQNIAIEGISFIATYSGATFMQSYTTNAAQKYIFTDVTWTGPWKYVFDLQGTNNNSEYSFYACGTGGMLDTGAFLYIGPTSTSDQFLNYWFYGFKHWSTGASIVRAYKGGHFHFYGVDCSAYGEAAAANNTLSSPTWLFEMRGNTHSYGVQTLTVEGMRVEAQHTTAGMAGLLFSEWANGNITIECDWSSAQGFITYGDIITITTGNNPGPIVHLHNSMLAGGIKVNYAINAHQTSPRIRVENTHWYQRLTPSEVVSWGDESGLGSNLARPSVEFINCRGSGVDATNGTTGVAVWDAIVGRRSLVQAQPKRSLRVGSVTGVLRGTSRVSLPVGAVITGMQVMAPPGAHTETDGGTWSVATTEGTPAPVISVAVNTSLAAGYLAGSQLTVPFLCSTRDQATLAITATGVTSGNYDAFLVIEGYW